MLNTLISQLQGVDWWSIANWAFLIFFIVLVGSVVEAIYRSRTPQSAMAWTMAISFMPVLGLLSYLLFGRRKFKGYIRGRDLTRPDITHAALSALNSISDHFTHPNFFKEGYQPEALEKILAMPFVKGNYVELLINAQATYDAIFATIKQAQHYVLLTYYIVRDDFVGQELREILEKKAKQGVAVFFLYDEIGSWKLAEGYVESLREAGVNILAFHTTKGWRNRFQLNFRNHRKLVVIDGDTVFAGGINIGKEYLGKKRRLSPWRDTHIKLEGAAALCAQLIFIEDWFWAAGEVPHIPNYQIENRSTSAKSFNSQITKINRQTAVDNVEALVMATGPAGKNLEACLQAYSYFISQAKKRIWITTPYFIPSQEILNNLSVAAMRGVDVRILIPQKADGIFVKLSSFSFVLDVLAYDVKVWRYKGFLHQKVLLIDDDIASVGSVNLDNRSFRLNFEANIIVRDSRFATIVAAMLEKDFSNSKKMLLEKEAKRPFIVKFLAKAARLLAPLQ